jgi:hypothetical protein
MSDVTDNIELGQRAIQWGKDQLANGNTLIVKAAENLPSATSFVGAISFITALVLFYLALTKLRDAHSTGQQRATYRESLLVLLSAIMLINLPEAIATFTASMYGTVSQSPLAYATAQSNPGENMGQKTLVAILAFVQFVGLLAFVRGWFVMHNIGKSSDASLGKALTHIIGGILAINIVDSANITAQSVGIKPLSHFLGA